MTGSIGTQGIPPRISADAVSSVCVVPEMPQKPRVMCNVYPCPNYAVRRGQCAVHLTAYERYRGTAKERGYDRRWERAAARFKEQYPLCGHRPDHQVPVMSQCYNEGRITLAYAVDHVIPHRGNEELRWDEQGNWQSLCRSCHSRKTKAGL